MKFPITPRRIASCRQLCFVLLLPLFSVFLWSQAPPAFAGTGSELMQEGNAAFAAGNFERAYDRFFKLFLLHSDNAEINFLLGRAAFEKGDFEAAVMAFERVLIVNPEALRVKLELGRCHMELKSFETARQFFLEVLAAKPPENVAQNIRIMLDELDQRQKKHHLHGMLALGYSHDDNPRVSPNDQNITLNFLPVTLAIDKPSDNFFSSSIGINHTYQNDTMSYLWKTSLVNYNAVYQYEDDLDLNYLQLTSGPAWQLQDALFEFHPLAGLVDVEHDRYLQVFGAEGIYSRMLGKDLMLQLTLRAEKRRNYDLHDRDATNLSLAMNEFFQFGKNMIRISAAAERENAHNPIYAYQKYSAGLHYHRLLPYNLLATAGAAIAGVRYDDRDPFFNVERNDGIGTLSLGLSKKLWASADELQAVTADLLYSFTNANSTVPVYTYDKHVTTATLAYVF